MRHYVTFPESLVQDPEGDALSMPVDTEAETARARATMREAGLSSLPVMAGPAGESITTGLVLFADSPALSVAEAGARGGKVGGRARTPAKAAAARANGARGGRPSAARKLLDSGEWSSAVDRDPSLLAEAERLADAARDAIADELADAEAEDPESARSTRARQEAARVQEECEALARRRE